MKKLVYLFVLILFACNSNTGNYGKLVSVSILPQKYFVDQISGGLVHVNVLVPPGADPHEYAVLPSQMRELSHSKAWLQIGLLDFEEAWKSKFADVSKNLRLVNCSKGIHLLSVKDEEESRALGSDPHVWLAPNDAKIVARNTFEALKNAFPEDSVSFRKNYTRFELEIDSLSIQIGEKLSGLTNRSFLIFHPTLGYFAREYQLDQIPIQFEGKEPSPRYMKELVDSAREKGIHTIFIQKEFDTENALQILREIKGKLVVIDPLDYNWKQQIMQIAQKLASQQ